MQMSHATFARPRSLRVSLKRGLAQQALAVAGRDSADLAALFAVAAGVRPNLKGLERMATRLAARPGVVRVALTADQRGICLTARALHEVEARVAGETAYRETGLVYLRARVEPGRGTTAFRLTAVSFCRHALERLVERSDLPLDAPLLPRLDGEARAIFRSRDQGTGFVEDGDAFQPASAAGLWAGGHDEMAPDPGWGLSTAGAPPLPVFSARTFLSAAEMRPTVYLRWKADPTCRMV